MPFVIYVAILVLVAAATETYPISKDSKPQYDLKDAPTLFEKFIKDYNRNYKDEADKQEHYESFVKSLETINRLNSDPDLASATFDINKFVDYTDAENKALDFD